MPGLWRKSQNDREISTDPAPKMKMAASLPKFGEIVYELGEVAEG
jgi:hypothetical protein